MNAFNFYSNLKVIPEVVNGINEAEVVEHQDNSIAYATNSTIEKRFKLQLIRE